MEKIESLQGRPQAVNLLPHGNSHHDNSPLPPEDDGRCPLCASAESAHYHADDRRVYLRCMRCGLVFVPRRFFLSPDEEKKRYDLHRNSSGDRGYRAFLNRLFVPLNRLLAPNSSGLDFGSGPKPVLAQMFEAAGHTVKIFDVFFKPDQSVFGSTYDFITCSEVAEHLREPRRELDRLWGRLRPGGILGIMTQPVADAGEFPQWHYKNDRTHLCFFSKATFSRLAGTWNAELASAEKDVFLFQKGFAGR